MADRAEESEQTRFVIIGAGEAGTRAALGLRNSGAHSVTLIGAELDAPYERPPLSKPEAGALTIRPIAADLAGIETVFGVAVQEIDRRVGEVVLSDGRHVRYDRLLLATGARPRTLPCDPYGVSLTLRTKEDAEAIFSRAQTGSHAIIIGAGLIGLELAAEFRERDMKVTVIEAAPRALGRVLPESVSSEIVARHRTEGVRFLFNAQIAAVEESCVSLANGTRLQADLVISAIGVVPETRLAEGANLPCANGIVVDSGFRTADPAIFAAGDCAAINHPHYGQFRFENWRNACDQGVAAARAMIGEDVAFTTHPWFWSDQYDMGLQMVGLHDPKRRSVQRDLKSGGCIVFELDQAGFLRSACGFGPGQAVAKDIRLAEALIARGARPGPDFLADPESNLKAFMRGG